MLSAPVYSDIEENSADFTEKIYHLSFSRESFNTWSRRWSRFNSSFWQENKLEEGTPVDIVVNWLVNM